MKMITIALTFLLTNTVSYAQNAQCAAAITAEINEARAAVEAGKSLDPRNPTAPGSCKAAHLVVALFKQNAVMMKKAQGICGTKPSAVEIQKKNAVQLSERIIPRYCNSSRGAN